MTTIGVKLTKNTVALSSTVQTHTVKLTNVTAGTGSSGYDHTQTTAAATWTIDHNLGYRPATACFYPSGTEFHGAVSHPTVNQTVIDFGQALAGSARLT